MGRERKGKNAADKHRKRQKEREKKKNAVRRKESRVVAGFKHDPHKVEKEIQTLLELKEQRKIDKKGRERLALLEDIMKKINQTKGGLDGLKRQARRKKKRDIKVVSKDLERVAGNVQLLLTNAPSGMWDDDAGDARAARRTPEMSIYYDPIRNPLGIPPPGKPQVYKSGFLTDGSAAANVNPALVLGPIRVDTLNAYRIPLPSGPPNDEIGMVPPPGVPPSVIAERERLKRLAEQQAKERAKERARAAAEERATVALDELPDAPPLPPANPLAFVPTNVVLNDAPKSGAGADNREAAPAKDGAISDASSDDGGGNGDGDGDGDGDVSPMAVDPSAAAALAEFDEAIGQL